MPRIVREAAAEVPSLGVRLSAAEEARKASGGGILNSMPVVHAMHRPFPHALKIKKRGACAALLSLAANTVLYGHFASIDLTSGAVIAYNI